MNLRRPVTAPLLLLAATMALPACSPSAPQGQQLTADPFNGQVSAPTGTATSGDPAQPQSETPQEPTNQTALTPELRRARGTLNIVVNDEAAIPHVLIDDFSTLTGLEVATTVFTPESGEVPVDVFVGFDAHALNNAHQAHFLASTAPADSQATTPLADIPAAVDYARDDVCVLADRQWYALNGAKPPTALASLADAGQAEKIVQAPTHSDSAAAFATFISETLKDKAGVWQTKLDAASPAPTTWDEAAAAHTTRLYSEPAAREVPGRPLWAAGASGPTAAPADPAAHTSGTRPLRVAPLSLLGRAVTNTGTESYLTPVSGTCAHRSLYAAASTAVNNPDGAEAFIEYLTSDRAQQILARTGAALPLDPHNAVGTLFEQVSAASRG